MCGFAGWIGRRDADLLTRFSSVLVHRGPDDDGRWSDELVSVCHRRLAIVDLEGGRQPMVSSTGRTVVVYNGEIYNYRELRAELRKAGCRFRTESDTEVLLAAYDTWGERCLERFNGMFALALYDRPARRVLLAVDRFGKKPLYYADTPRGLAFGSTMAVLRQHPAVSLELDLDSLAGYFLHGHVSAPGTIFRGVRKLPGGRVLAVDVDAPASAAAPRAYWEPRFEPKLRMTRADAVEGVRHFLTAAVQRRLNADVPIGAALSGGLDSSSVVALMADTRPAALRTFSIGFTEAAYDEAPVARRVAQHFGSTHQEQVMGTGHALEAMPRALAACDEPLADDSLIPTYVLCRFARESVKVLLSGDGGDELFAGYDFFAAERAFQWLRRVPSPVARLAAVAGAWLPHGVHRRFDYRLPEFLASHSLDAAARHQLWLGPCAPSDLRRLFTPAAFEQLRPGAGGADALASSDARSDLDRLIHLYFRSTLQNGILVKVDRAAMAHGLEVRSPLLDVDLVDFVNRLPSSWKHAGWNRKRLLRDAMRHRLPPEVLTRPKRGFALPVGTWLRGPLRSTLDFALSSETLRRDGLFEPAYVRRLVDEHIDGRWGHRRLLWALLAFQCWSATSVRTGVPCHA
jgi:asparagine synthase (glutamine-hydrolysing)